MPLLQTLQVNSTTPCLRLDFNKILHIHMSKMRIPEFLTHPLDDEKVDLL